MARLKLTFLVISAWVYGGCGKTVVDTGRNSQPQKDPTEESPAAQEDDPTTQPGDQQTPGSIPPNGNNKPSSGKEPRPNSPVFANPRQCLAAKAAQVPDILPKVCSSGALDGDGIAVMRKMLCEDKMSAYALQNPACSWNGDPKRAKSYLYVAKETAVQDPGPDFEQIAITSVRSPVSQEKAKNLYRFALEDYANFQKTYRWIKGTREQTKISGGDIFSGFEYKYRIEKASYDLSYVGAVKMTDIAPGFTVLVNGGVRDFVRFKKLNQILFIFQLGNESVVFKIEHKIIFSDRLHALARDSSIDSLIDSMEATYANNTK